MQILENVGERNAFTVTLLLEDGNGAQAIPSAVDWRIVCPDDDDAEVVAWTSTSIYNGVKDDGITPTCYVVFSVPASAAEMLTTKDLELRALIVAADRDTDSEFNEEFQYYVERRNARS